MNSGQRRTNAGDDVVQDDLTIHVPIRLARRRGRKMTVAPAGAPEPETATRRRDDVLLAALGRGWRWRRMLDGGDYATSGDLAAAVWVAHSYVCRYVRLTLLAPDIVETILDGRQPRGMTLGALLKVTSPNSAREVNPQPQGAHRSVVKAGGDPSTYHGVSVPDGASAR